MKYFINYVIGCYAVIGLFYVLNNVKKVGAFNEY